MITYNENEVVLRLLLFLINWFSILPIAYSELLTLFNSILIKWILCEL